MLNKINKLLIFTATLLLATACENVVEFDIDDSDRFIVVNALPCSDSLVFTNITYSRFFLDNQVFPAVTNATVTLEANGTSYNYANRDGANYNFAYRAIAGDTLTMHVSIPGRETIVGGTRIPALPIMQAPTAEIDTLMPFNTAEITFTLSDPAGDNYYYIYISERDSGIHWNQWESKWDTIDTVKRAYFNCVNFEITNPEVNSIEGMMNYFNRLLFTDKLIDQQDYDVKLSMMMLKDTAEHPMLRQYSLIVESFSREAYRYTQEVIAAQGIRSRFSEPTRIYSNLNGALGIFAGIARRQYPLTFTYKQLEEDVKKAKKR